MGRVVGAFWRLVALIAGLSFWRGGWAGLGWAGLGWAGLGWANREDILCL